MQGLLRPTGRFARRQPGQARSRLQKEFLSLALQRGAPPFLMPHGGPSQQPWVLKSHQGRAFPVTKQPVPGVKEFSHRTVKLWSREGRTSLRRGSVFPQVRGARPGISRVLLCSGLRKNLAQREPHPSVPTVSPGGASGDGAVVSPDLQPRCCCWFLSGALLSSLASSLLPSLGFLLAPVFSLCKDSLRRSGDPRRLCLSCCSWIRAHS